MLKGYQTGQILMDTPTRPFRACVQERDQRSAVGDPFKNPTYPLEDLAASKNPRPNQRLFPVQPLSSRLVFYVCTLSQSQVLVLQNA